MAEQTKIEWTNRRAADGSIVEGKTFNPWIGCTKVSPACANCYAERDALRYGRVVWGPASGGGTRSLTSNENWQQPYKWMRAALRAGVRPLVFVASWADVFEQWDGPVINHKGELIVMRGGHPARRTWESIPWLGSGGSPGEGDWLEVIADAQKEQPPGSDPLHPVTMSDMRRELFRVIARTAPALDWLVLTKRPDVFMKEYTKVYAAYSVELEKIVADTRPRGSELDRDLLPPALYKPAHDFLEKHGLMPNVWAGTTVESQEYVGRLNALCNVPAVRRFVSAEPMVGPLFVQGEREENGKSLVYNFLSHPPAFPADSPAWPLNPDLPGIHWVITGGESGPGARPAHTQWYTSLRDQARSTGTPFFFKQWGEFLNVSDATPDDVPAGTAEANVYQEGLPDTAATRELCRAGKVSLPMLTFRVGKKAAGRMLDGVEWSEIPDSALPNPDPSVLVKGGVS